jgi:hypothetical protein
MPDNEQDALTSAEANSLVEVAVALPLFHTLTYRIPPAIQNIAPPETLFHTLT